MIARAIAVGIICAPFISAALLGLARAGGARPRQPRPKDQPMTTPADELRAAAAKLRDLATRTSITLERHELQWIDLTVTGGPGRVSPMVWSQYAAAMAPAVGLALADWLDSAAEDAEQIGADHRALATARAINGTEQP